MGKLEDALTIIEAEIEIATAERKEAEDEIDRLSDKMSTIGFSKKIDRVDYRMERLKEAAVAIRKLLPPPK